MFFDFPVLLAFAVSRTFPDLGRVSYFFSRLFSSTFCLHRVSCFFPNLGRVSYFFSRLFSVLFDVWHSTHYSADPTFVILMACVHFSDTILFVRVDDTV